MSVMPFEDLKSAYETLATAIDQAGAEREALFLTRLALVLGHELGDIELSGMPFGRRSRISNRPPGGGGRQCRTTPSAHDNLSIKIGCNFCTASYDVRNLINPTLGASAMANASDPVVILSAARTPLGRFMGELSPFSAHKLGSHVIGAALERAKLAPERIDEVFMGNVLPAGQGQAPARQPPVAPDCRMPPAPPPSTRSAVPA